MTPVEEKHNPADLGPPRPLFPLGRIHITFAARRATALAGIDRFKLLDRHAAADWGTINEHNRRINNAAIWENGRILSAYPLDRSQPNGLRIWIITEGDRPDTTMLLPEEF